MRALILTTFDLDEYLVRARAPDETAAEAWPASTHYRTGQAANATDGTLSKGRPVRGAGAPYPYGGWRHRKQREDS